MKSRLLSASTYPYRLLGTLSCALVVACGAPDDANYDSVEGAADEQPLEATGSELNLGFVANGAPWVIQGDMELSQFQWTTVAAKAAGYRLTSLSAYDSSGSARFNAIYEPNNAGEWRYAVQLTAAQLEAELQNARNDNFRPTAIDAYRVGSEVRYAVLLTDNSTSNLDWFVRLGLTASQYQTDFNANGAAGYRPEHITGYSVNGTSYFSAIWVPAQEAWLAVHNMTAAQYQTAFTNNKQAGFSLVQVDGHVASNGSARYSAIWLHHADLLTSGQHGYSWSKLEEFALDQERSGFRPLCIDTFGSGTNVHFAAAWKADLYPKAVLNNIDTIVRNTMNTHGVRGLSLALAKNGQLKLARGYGKAVDLLIGSPTPVTTHTRFRWASVSKPITAAAAFKLVEQGQLSLSAPVFGTGGLLSSRFPPPYAYDVSHITVRDLLEHTSGGWSNASATDPMSDQLSLGTDAIIEWVLDAPQHAVTAPPAGQPKPSMYSNFGYLLLGRVIEQVTGKTYEQAVQELLFVPAGATTFAIGGNSIEEALPNEARYYGALLGSANPYNAAVRRADSAGGWVGTPTDLLRVMVRIDGRPNPTDLITAASFQGMTTPSTACGSGPCNYARSWGIGGPTGTSTGFDWFHNGALSGTRSLVYNRADGISWAVVINDTSAGAPYLADGPMTNMMNSVLAAAGTLHNADLF